jgi:hypothetical protein
MPEGDPRWIALTTIDVIAILVGAVVLVTERAVAGYVITLAGALLFLAMWTLRRKPTEQALRTLLWAIIWFSTGGSGGLRR